MVFGMRKGSKGDWMYSEDPRVAVTLVKRNGNGGKFDHCIVMDYGNKDSPLRITYGHPAVFGVCFPTISDVANYLFKRLEEDRTLSGREDLRYIFNEDSVRNRPGRIISLNDINFLKGALD